MSRWVGYFCCLAVMVFCGHARGQDSADSVLHHRHRRPSGPGHDGATAVVFARLVAPSATRW